MKIERLEMEGEAKDREILMLREKMKALQKELAWHHQVASEKESRRGEEDEEEDANM